MHNFAILQQLPFHYCVARTQLSEDSPPTTFISEGFFSKETYRSLPADLRCKILQQNIFKALLKLPYEFTAAYNELVLRGHNFNEAKRKKLKAFFDDRFQRMFARDGYEQDPHVRAWAFRWLLRVVHRRQKRVLDGLWTGDSPSLANRVIYRPWLAKRDGWPAPCPLKMEDDFLLDGERLIEWYLYLYEVECEVVLQVRDDTMRFAEVGVELEATAPADKVGGADALEEAGAVAGTAASAWKDVTDDLGHLALLWAEYLPHVIPYKIFCLMFDPELRKGCC